MYKIYLSFSWTINNVVLLNIKVNSSLSLLPFYKSKSNSSSNVNKEIIIIIIIIDKDKKKRKREVKKINK